MGTPIGGPAIGEWIIGFGDATMGDGTIWLSIDGGISLGNMKFISKSRTAGNSEHSPLCAL